MIAIPFTKLLREEMKREAKRGVDTYMGGETEKKRSKFQFKFFPRYLVSFSNETWEGFQVLRNVIQPVLHLILMSGTHLESAASPREDQAKAFPVQPAFRAAGQACPPCSPEYPAASLSAY